MTMKKTISALAAGFVALSLTAAAMAESFIDMPQNWTTSALENAVKNGLLSGYENKIMPDDNITRAQMAAIIVRAFGATEGEDISQYADVSADKWYYSELGKAVKMGAFKGDGQNMNPENFITFQECFTVVSQVFFLNKPEETKIDEILSSFSDAAEVSAWAKSYAASVVENGYWDGIDGKLTPTAYITRSQFAVLMDKLVKTYVDQPGVYSEFEPGNILLRSEGITIDGLTTDSDLILGEGTGMNTMEVKNFNTAGTLLIRGGGKVTVSESKVGRFMLEKAGVSASLENVQYDYIASCADTYLELGIIDDDRVVPIE